MNTNNNNKRHQKQSGGGGGQQPPPRGENCPRCDSTNTKFCYYNNYSKSQPRYFCKGCKRHWTKGGTLRNVPIGGARKNKRFKTSNISIAAASTTANQEEAPFRLPTLPELPQSQGLQMFPFSEAADGSSSSSFDSLGQSSRVFEFDYTGKEAFVENRIWENSGSSWNWGDLDALVSSSGFGVPWYDGSEIFKL